MSEHKQRETMLYGEHQYAVVRCERYKGQECVVVRNPHNNLPIGTQGGHVLRLRAEIREMHTDADRAVMEGTGAFARGVYMTKDELAEPGLFTSCTIMNTMIGYEEYEHRR